MEGRRTHLQFLTFRRRFVCRWHLTMQGIETSPKVSKYRRRSQKLYSINCGHDGLCIRLTYVRLPIHCTDCLDLSIKVIVSDTHTTSDFLSPISSCWVVMFLDSNRLHFSVGNIC